MVIAEGQPSPLRRNARTALMLFLCLTFLYLLTSTGRVHTIDEISTVIQTESLVLHGTTAIPQALNSKIYFGKIDRQGQARSPYPPGQSLATAPWYALGYYVLAKLPGVVPDIRDLVVSMASLWSNAEYAALSVTLFFLLAVSLGLSRRDALLSTGVVGLASLLFVYSGWLFSEPLTTAIWLGAALALFGIEQGHEISSRRAIIAGLLLGFSLHVRPTNLFGTFIFIAAVLLRNSPKKIQTAAIVSAAVGTAGIIYLLRNYSFYGNALEFGYPQFVEGGREANTFDNPIYIGLFGFLFSPGKSIILFCPPILLGIVGLSRLWRRDRGLALVCGAIPLIYLLFYSIYGNWEGTYSYGPRYLVPSAVLLCVGICGLFLEKPAWFGRALATVFALGFLVQVIGLSTNIIEDMVGNRYYDAKWNYQLGYSAITGQLHLIGKYLGGAPAGLGMGFDRWFLFLRKAGVPGSTVAMMLIPIVIGFLVFGWMLLREFREAEA